MKADREGFKNDKKKILKKFFATENGEFQSSLHPPPSDGQFH